GGTRRADTSDDLLDAGREGQPARAAEAARQHDEAGVEDDVDRRHAVGDAAGQLVEEGAAADLVGGGRADAVDRGRLGDPVLVGEGADPVRADQGAVAAGEGRDDPRRRLGDALVGGAAPGRAEGQRRPGDRQVADLAGAAGPAAVQPAAQHHRHAHAAVEPHEGEVVGALRGAVLALGDGGEVDVVLYRHRTPQV